ncbi:hypothetical protein RJ639_002231 [Escallonia herrerae]|uniref:GRPD C-terminal domain-containing protein n=1 Tax=Escallonia herrerae TaxID=1293975 RepID=A0AA89BI38_9ASTE|nr:hypothetical protein RJ639_002231 [Escallonia herrerae]
MSVSDGTSTTRSLSEISEQETVRLSIDLVAAARHNLGFLRLVAESQWLHQRPTTVEAFRRQVKELYDELWMPLISDLMVGSNPPMIVPPLDIEWVWFCHTLNPVSYRQYCESRFSKLTGKLAIFNEENEEYALDVCREIWIRKYPCEPFENEVDSNMEDPVGRHEDLLGEVLKQKCLYTRFSEPYMSELFGRSKTTVQGVSVYAAEVWRWDILFGTYLRYITDVVDPSGGYPTAYSADVKEIEGYLGKMVAALETVKEEEVQETKKLWEKTFYQPYEKAGCPVIIGAVKVKPPIYWVVTNTDANVKYKSMVPRFLLEVLDIRIDGSLTVVQYFDIKAVGRIHKSKKFVKYSYQYLMQYLKVCVMVRLNSDRKNMQGDSTNEFLRCRMIRGHGDLKLNTPIHKFPLDSWKKAWHLYCEFGTKGIVTELRGRGGHCFKGSQLRDSVTFTWNDLLRAPSLTLGKECDEKVRVVASMTPPVQGAYLLKCVPDRVTDDSGAMVSDVILRMNQYQPQEGRWLSRTVLDHLGRECFILRMRVGAGLWRRGGETPSNVKHEDRIVEIREGKVVGTATPKVRSEGWQASWSFSAGDELLIRWEPSTSISGLSFQLTSCTSTESLVRLLKGRQMEYGTEVKESRHVNDDTEEEEEDGFVTLVRYSEENSTGKATALLNWKLSVVELQPEEDAVFVLLLCMTILRSVSEIRKEDVGNLLLRRRQKEAKPGSRDWGSVILHPSSSSCSTSMSSPHLHPWYWNAKAVMASDGVDHVTRQPALGYSPEEGGDKLYKRGLIA